jgi:hypothetical protein
VFRRRFVIADARRQGRRGQRGAPHWTNDVDAGAGWRRLDIEPSVLEGHSVAITRPTEVGGQAGDPAAGHLFAPRRRMVVFGHNHDGLTHLLDHAPVGGVMPLLELAPRL